MSRKRMLYMLIVLAVVSGIVLTAWAAAARSSVAAATSGPAGMWHTPAYQGYTPTTDIQSPEPHYGDVQADCTSFCP